MPERDEDERERWLEHYRKAGERDADFETLSGVPLLPLYTPQEVQHLDYQRDLGYPGHAPMTRGVYHTMYRGRLWTMRQFAGFGSAQETNARYKFLLQHGQGGLSVAFDMPTLMGRDSDDPRSEGEVGSTAPQELAFTLADGFSYVELGQQRGLDVDHFAQGLSFFFNSHIDFFEEIAKFRAARRIWARWLRDVYGAVEEQSLRLRFHTQTAGCSLTAQQPENNIVRTALEALAAVLGGTQSLHTNALDEVLALPTEKAAQIALRTQQIIAYETGAANVIDPLGGSYFVEALTDE